MNVQTITVTASRKFNHPYEQYSNFGHSIQLTAELLPGDVPSDSMRLLHKAAEEQAENHKQQILTELSVEQNRAGLEASIRRLEQTPAYLKRLAEKIEKEKAMGSEARPWVIDETQEEIDSWQDWRSRLATAQEQLAALPPPIILPLSKIHPGHPDHPQTTDFND